MSSWLKLSLPTRDDSPEPCPSPDISTSSSSGGEVLNFLDTILTSQNRNNYTYYPPCVSWPPVWHDRFLKCFRYGNSLFWYLTTNAHPDTVNVPCRTLILEVVFCLVRFIHWQESPVTIWNMTIVHTGEVHRRSAVSLSTSFTWDSLNTFTM